MALKVTSTGRVVLPSPGHTTGDAVRYNERAALRILPHIAGRPLTGRRSPRGVGAPGVFHGDRVRS